MKVRLLFGASMALLLVAAGCSSSSEGNDSALRVLGHSLATLSPESVVLAIACHLIPSQKHSTVALARDDASALSLLAESVLRALAGMLIQVH